MTLDCSGTRGLRSPTADAVVRCGGRAVPSEDSLARLRSLLTAIEPPSDVADKDGHGAFPQRVLEQVRRHMVLPQFNEALRRLRSAAGGIAPGWHTATATAYRQATAHHAHALAGAALCASLLREAGTRPLFLKGLALQELYPSPSWRYMADVDTLLPDLPAARSALAALASAGGRVEDGWVAGRETALYGSANVHFLSRGFKVDLHFGPFPVDCCAGYPLPLFERARPTPLGNQEMLVPSREDLLLILVAHVANHGYHVMRDLNDLALLATDPSLDWGYIAHWTSQLGVSPTLASLADALRRDGQLVAAPEFLVRSRADKHWLFRFGRCAPDLASAYLIARTVRRHRRASGVLRALDAWFHLAPPALCPTPLLDMPWRGYASGHLCGRREWKRVSPACCSAAAGPGPHAGDSGRSLLPGSLPSGATRAGLPVLAWNQGLYLEGVNLNTGDLSSPRRSVGN